MPDEDEFLNGEFYSSDDLRRGFDAIIDQFVEDFNPEDDDYEPTI